MSEEKNIINYTAADIEKYWNGKLSPAEMHAMEKAAMDDPFLADAMEGYKNESLADSELDSLKERLDKRIGAVVPILNLKRKRFTWVRAAAAIIIIVGFGLLVQQLVFNDKNKNAMAILEKDDKRPESTTTKDQVKPDSIIKEVPAQSGSVANKSEQKVSVSPNAGSHVSSNPDKIKEANRSDDEYKKRETEKVAEINAQAIASAEKKDESIKAEANVIYSNDTSKSSNKKVLNSPVSMERAKASRAYYENDKKNEVALNNKYNYRVVDAQNNPVPFANVTNTRDNVGTYTDIRGNFNLVSSDSILHVQIRSLGYDAANYKLVPSNTQPGDLLLKEGEMKETISQNRKVVSSLSRKDSAEIEEPEVGWGYYNTYVANNIKIPENVRSKNSRSDVELSFDVDKTGAPINIKVTKSSQCKECDEEAIRLLKEGPRWKRKGKKSKATVSIAVDQK
ncbi:MAG TPA: TonB family protein [Chitinophagaceae bacterium]|nr:TonB family protein [Chitinophagaceae bacterium]